MNKDFLYWERFRPKTMKNLILLPRIKDFLAKGINTHLIFYGTPGVGKSTLAHILSKDNPTLVLNSSLNTSIDTLRTTITDFIRKLDFNYPSDVKKIIILDEFERVSDQYQDALKGFMEMYHEHARFILTTNHINKVGELSSRINKVNFNPTNKEEENYLKKEYFLYLKKIVKGVKADDLIQDVHIDKIINKFFPDLRAAVQMVQEIDISKNLNTIDSSASGSQNVELYNFILSGRCDSIEVFKYVTENLMGEIDTIFDNLGRSFFKYLMDIKPDLLNKIAPRLIKLQKEYNETLHITVDPMIHLVSYILDVKKIIDDKK